MKGMEQKVRLYVDNSPESRKAEQVLRDSNVSYDVLPSSRPGPTAQVGTDFFTGLSGITLLGRSNLAKKGD